MFFSEFYRDPKKATSPPTPNIVLWRVVMVTWFPVASASTVITVVTVYAPPGLTPGDRTDGVGNPSTPASVILTAGRPASTQVLSAAHASAELVHAFRQFLLRHVCGLRLAAVGGFGLDSV
ncbi:hypothetical protein GCM10010211_70900 [Streptomyces albospinus]|uniref:Uncharacterized protein n=1 Tax=Streptomyces albospinus TaxID=285515 RepID=A0ABQ2VL55_9ACTN|nr:hypothetical protein GCM10010211_70900 [Streptomyces albospinus]